MRRLGVCFALVFLLSALLWACVWVRPGVPVVGLSSPTTLNPTGDTEMRFLTPNTNYGSGTTSYVGRDKQLNIFELLLLFDVSSVPAGSTVTSATLGVYHVDMYGSEANFVLSAYRVIRVWTAAAATWNTATTGVAWGTAGCANTTTDRSGTAEYTRTVGYATMGVYLSGTVTSLVQGWVDGTYTNSGVLLTGSAVDSAGIFNTVDNAANKPQLYVAYTEATPTATATETPTPTLTSTPTSTPTPTPTPTVTPICPVTIAPDTTWGPGTVRVNCNVGVPAGVTLTIEAGTTVELLGDYHVDVEGTLWAYGTAALPITFTTAVSSVAGTWGNVYLRGEASTLRYVTVLYGAGVNDAAGSELRYVTVQTCTFGLASMSATDVSSSTFQYCGTGLLMYLGAEPTISACNVLSNTYWAGEIGQSQAITTTACWWGADPPDDGAVLDGLDDLRRGLLYRDDYATGPVGW